MTNDIAALVTELEPMIAQLIRCEAHAAFGGAGTSVRVKDAPYLIELLQRAAAALQSLQAERGAAVEKNDRYFEEVSACYDTIANERQALAAAQETIRRQREALIEIGRDAGCFLADDVSTDFLMLIPGELRARAALEPSGGER